MQPILESWRQTARYAIALRPRIGADNWKSWAGTSANLIVLIVVLMPALERWATVETAFNHALAFIATYFGFLTLWRVVGTQSRNVSAELQVIADTDGQWIAAQRWLARGMIGLAYLVALPLVVATGAPIGRSLPSLAATTAMAALPWLAIAELLTTPSTIRRHRRVAVLLAIMCLGPMFVTFVIAVSVEYGLVSRSAVKDVASAFARLLGRSIWSAFRQPSEWRGLVGWVGIWAAVAVLGRLLNPTRPCQDIRLMDDELRPGRVRTARQSVRRWLVAFGFRLGSRSRKTKPPHRWTGEPIDFARNHRILFRWRVVIATMLLPLLIGFAYWDYPIRWTAAAERLANALWLSFAIGCLMQICASPAQLSPILEGDLEDEQLPLLAIAGVEPERIVAGLIQAARRVMDRWAIATVVVLAALLALNEPLSASQPVRVLPIIEKLAALFGLALLWWACRRVMPAATIVSHRGSVLQQIGYLFSPRTGDRDAARMIRERTARMAGVLD